MGKRVGIVLTILAALLLGMGGVVYWRSGLPAGLQAGVSPVAGDSPPATVLSPAGASQTIPEPRQAAALPPMTSPLHTVAGELERRAALGEAAATCRLASGYAYCGRLPERRAGMDRWLARQQQVLAAAQAGPNTQALSEAIDQQMQLRQDGIDRMAAHCGEVVVPGPAEIARLWRTAALAGNPAAMKHYASGNGFRWASMLDALPELATYRQEAERIATVAASRGDMDLLLALAAGYNPSHPGRRPLLAQALEPDAARALALYRHIEAALRTDDHKDLRVSVEVRDRIATLEQGLPAAQRLRAANIAQSELSAWRAPVVRGAASLNALGYTRDIDRGWCQR